MWPAMTGSTGCGSTFPLDKGYYCMVEGNVNVDEPFLERVSGRMKKLFHQRIPIDKRSIHTEEAVALFHRHGMWVTRERLFEYRRVSKVNIYSMNEFGRLLLRIHGPGQDVSDIFRFICMTAGSVIQMPVKEKPETSGISSEPEALPCAEGIRALGGLSEY